MHIRASEYPEGTLRVPLEYPSSTRRAPESAPHRMHIRAVREQRLRRRRVPELSGPMERRRPEAAGMRVLIFALRVLIFALMGTDIRT